MGAAPKSSRVIGRGFLASKPATVNAATTFLEVRAFFSVPGMETPSDRSGPTGTHAARTANAAKIT